VSDEKGKRVFRELQALARADYGGNTGALLVVYAVEGFLRRLAASTYATKMTLKGGMLMTARLTATLDFSFGDPQRSTVIELPELLGEGTIRLASYLPEMTLAEKIATMMSRRELNTRDRDFADVWVLSRVQAIAAPKLREAIVEVAGRRKHDVVPLFEALADMPDRQVSYTAMLNRMAYQRVPPTSWSELLADVRAFVDPLVTDTTDTLKAWDPATLRWTS
jgi:hypothetical protein